VAVIRQFVVYGNFTKKRENTIGIYWFPLIAKQRYARRYTNNVSIGGLQLYNLYGCPSNQYNHIKINI